MLDILASRNIKTESEIEEFLNPSISLLENNVEMLGAKKAAERIKHAIENCESIVIYGDYDADGVCASAILYLYLKSKNANVQVFIPNRFKHGYGLSEETIGEIAENYFPDLVITVDCGITAEKEVDLLLELGIDVIITDHHLPVGKIPNAVAVVDPKQQNETYPYKDFCGAGVALKLVQTLGGNVMDYIDIASVATIGDIVPLTGENRVITSIGLKKINSGSCNNGIAALKQIVCRSEQLSSEDVAFKIVPRLNAAGRIENAIISFNLLVSSSKDQAQEIVQELEHINSIRLDKINAAMQEIYKNLKVQNLENQKFILVCSKNFHEGILGIVAARLVSEYGAPAFVFCESDQNLLKGSCRSPENVDIHETLVSMSNLFINFGGHKQAAGITISKDNLEILKQKLQQQLPEAKKEQTKFDFEITENEITLDFAKQLDLLEPTGCGNEKPIFKIKINNFTYKKTTNPKHFQLISPNKLYLPCFNGKKYQESVLSGNATAYFTLGTQIYNNQYRLNPKIQEICCDGITETTENQDLAQICDAFYAINSKNCIEILPTKNDLLSLAKELAKFSGTVVVARTIKELTEANETLKLPCYYFLPSNQQSCILYCPKAIEMSENMQKYSSVVLLSGSLTNLSQFSDKKVYSYFAKFPDVSQDKSIFASCYRVFAGQKIAEQNDIYEYIEEISKYLCCSRQQTAFCIAVFAELKLIKTESQNGGFLLSIEAANKKTNLLDSKLYNAAKSTEN